MRVINGAGFAVLILPHAGLLLIHDAARLLAGQAERTLRWYDDLVRHRAGWAWGMHQGRNRAERK